MDSEDGPETDYWVSEMTPELDPPAPPPPAGPEFPILPDDEINPERRPVTLKIDLESVQVRQIEAVSFKTTRHAVRRNRFSKRDLEF
jgi:hypothetical protein